MSSRKIDTQRNQIPEDDGNWCSTWGGMRNTKDTEGSAAVEPPGVDRDLVAIRGRKRGGQTDAGYGGKRRHAERDTEQDAEHSTEAGRWQVRETSRWMAFFRERRWGLSVIDRCSDDNRY